MAENLSEALGALEGAMKRVYLVWESEVEGQWNAIDVRLGILGAGESPGEALEDAQGAVRECLEMEPDPMHYVGWGAREIMEVVNEGR